MNDFSNEQKIAMAKAAAEMAYKFLQTCPPQIQLEAGVILLKALFLAHVKDTHRVSMFSSISKRLKDELKQHKPGVTQ